MADLQAEAAAVFRERLLEWWENNKRSFPWRDKKDPYAVLVAEFLLQKTDAQKVVHVYEEFLRRFPTPESLAEAPKEAIKELLQPLGLFYRAERLQKTARAIVEKFSGLIPNTFEQLRGLPGIGRYIANAVLCFAYGHRVPLIDTNTGRILMRVFGFKPRKARAREDNALWEFAHCLTPANACREYNFALIDFAHLVCKAKNPECTACPINAICKFWTNQGIS